MFSIIKSFEAQIIYSSSNQGLILVIHGASYSDFQCDRRRQ